MIKINKIKVNKNTESVKKIKVKDKDVIKPVKQKNVKVSNIAQVKGMLDLSNEIMKELERLLPKNMKVVENYKGPYEKYMLEYVNTFIVPELKTKNKKTKKVEIKKLSDIEKTDYWMEVTYIECFCRWLDREKKILPSK